MEEALEIMHPIPSFHIHAHRLSSLSKVTQASDIGLGPKVRSSTPGHIGFSYMHLVCV